MESLRFQPPGCRIWVVATEDGPEEGRFLWDTRPDGEPCRPELHVSLALDRSELFRLAMDCEQRWKWVLEAHEQRKRQQELLHLVRSSTQSTEELSDGYAFRLAAEPALFQQAAEWVTLERRCCPFVQFGLEWRTDQTVWVRMTGGPGVKEALKAEILEVDAQPR